MTTENDIEQQEVDYEEPEISVDGMVDRIIDGDNTGAQADFEALISAKLSDALDAKKVEVARSIYGDEEEDNDQYEDEQEVEQEDESEEEEDER